MGGRYTGICCAFICLHLKHVLINIVLHIYAIVNLKTSSVLSEFFFFFGMGNLAYLEDLLQLFMVFYSFKIFFPKLRILAYLFILCV